MRSERPARRAPAALAPPEQTPSARVSTGPGSSVRWLESGDLRVAYELWGTGPPVLLLNGLTLPSASWGPLVALLSTMTERTFIAVDGPGVGRSPRPPSVVPISTWAKLAVSLLDAAGVGACDVIGYSHGGAVAQQLAAVDPGRVRRLVLAATSCGVGCVPGNLGVLLNGIAWHRTAEGRALRADPLGALWQAWSYATWSSVGLLGAIRQPTLVVTGAYDLIVPAVNGRMLARRIPDCRYVELPTDHDLFGADRVGLTADAIERFLVRG